MKQFCKDCVYYMSGKCGLNGEAAPIDACNKFYNERYECAICHKPIYHEQVIYDDALKQSICPSCLDHLSSCSFCAHADTCAYEQDPSPLPKVIQRKTPFGITQSRNPEREQALCTKCSCWNNGCSRQGEPCSNFKGIM